MELRTRLTIGVVLTLTALCVVAATAAATRPVTDARQIRPGLSDFALSDTQIGVAPAPVTDARQVRPGLSDFGLSPNQFTVEPNGPSAKQPVAARRIGFDWADAGVGAAAMLGIVLLAGGLVAAVVIRSHSGEFRSA